MDTDKNEDSRSGTMDCHATAGAASRNDDKHATTQNEDSKPAHRRQDFAIFDKNTTNLSDLAQDSRICDEKSGLFKDSQGRALSVRNRRESAEIADLSRKAESTKEAESPQTQIPLIDLHAQYHAYKHELDSAIASVLHSQHFILGEHSQALESELASFVGRRFCITCSSGTNALLLALLALDIGAGDEVITPSFSFIAAAEMVAFLGAKPVFVDICPSTYTLDIAQVKRAITPRTRAIIPVCLFGLPYDVSGLESLARIHAIPIIEDGAQSFGAAIVNPSGEQAERRSGSFGDLSITSFFPAKPLGGYGDGGAVFCDDENLAQRLRTLRNHGQTSKYRHTTLGLNTRLDELQCAILRVKLRHFPKELEARQNLARRYFALLAKDSRLDSSRTDSRTPESSLSKSSTPDSRLCLPHIPKGRRSSFAQFCLQAQSTESREQILLTLACHGIATAIHYPAPLHLQEAFAYLGYKRGDFPVSECVSERIFSIPLCAFLSPSAQEQIAKVLCRF
ncbi:DegT/DnrJ/EryC1/StrS family aminotransferase [uncultured Helicobacter sp.]|uniref:DegT/DnrJ/EryC1/StrS family aminotransferase n=1 Tax=uncultured Helicobacter sp. TaxID=175537 RepID=UPI002619E919|nr:DegT/DnrJ/EryC1/StrS family aminotransferase [uncultured Helicobacter sp.]